jgi:hypothetical protein
MIPFSNGNDIKKAASQVAISIDIDNLRTSLEGVEDDFRDIIGDAAYDDILSHYSTPPEETDADMDTLLRYLQSAMAHMALYHHFVFMQIDIGNNGITTYKSDNKTTAFKYQTDEAKEKLLNIAWKQMSRLIDKMDDMEYVPWQNSTQYTEMQDLLFENYRDFNKYFDIGRNASFYIRLRYILKNEVLDDIIDSMNIDLDTASDKLTKMLKKYVAYKVMSVACLRFDYHFLPEAIRSSFSNEHNRKDRYNDKETVREKVVNGIAQKAEKYLRDIELYQYSKDNDTVDAEHMNENFAIDNNKDKKYFNGL